MSPTKLDPTQQPSNHANLQTIQNICMTLEKMTNQFQMPQKHLVKKIKPYIAAESFDDLRCVIYATRKTTFSKLAPTSSAVKGHLL